ncbi:MAG: hypothetical protein P3X22_004625 [Thermoprotei archaeon]|nr:hypothetical protein [Thermoprotei archaeon]
MPRIVKIILDTAEFHPLHKDWVRLARKLAEKLEVELEIKNEDYVYAIEHGETDDLGMAWLPQLFAQLEDGTVKLVLSRYPFNPETVKPSEELAVKEAEEKIRQILES